MNTFDFLMSTSAVSEANKLLETIEGYIPKVFDFAVNIVLSPTFTPFFHVFVLKTFVFP